MSRAVLVPPDFDPVPSAGRTVIVNVGLLTSASGQGALGIPVRAAGEPSPSLGLDRDALARAGFEGKPGDTLVQVLRSADASQEQAWQLPLEHAYRRELESDVADLTNMGGPNAGAITAALFLAEFTGGLPWAHIDIAGLAQVDRPEFWRTSGCSGFGARLLADLAIGFIPPDRAGAVPRQSTSSTRLSRTTCAYSRTYYAHRGTCQLLGVKRV